MHNKQQRIAKHFHSRLYINAVYRCCHGTQFECFACMCVRLWLAFRLHFFYPQNIFYWKKIAEDLFYVRYVLCMPVCVYLLVSVSVSECFQPTIYSTLPKSSSDE